MGIEWVHSSGVWSGEAAGRSGRGTHRTTQEVVEIGVEGLGANVGAV